MRLSVLLALVLALATTLPVSVVCGNEVEVEGAVNAQSQEALSQDHASSAASIEEIRAELDNGIPADYDDDVAVEDVEHDESDGNESEEEEEEVFDADSLGAARKRRQSSSQQEKTANGASGDAKKSDQPLRPLNPARVGMPFKAEDYIFELIMFIVFASYGIIFLHGKNVNERMARMWCEVAVKSFTSQFSQVGINETEQLFMDGYADFVFYATGRRYCENLTAKISLIYRHELVSLMYDLVNPVEDKVNIEVVMNEANMDPFIFAVIPKKREKAIRKARYDLTVFPRVVQHSLLPDSLMLLTDAPELADTILTPAFVDIIKKNLHLFDYFVLSDQSAALPTKENYLNPVPKKLLFSFRIATENYVEFADLNQLVAQTIDVVAEKCKLRPETKEKCLKLREKAIEGLTKQTLAERQEADQKRKAEKKKKEKEEAEKAGPEALRKWEENEYKKNLKKNSLGSKAKVMR